MHASPSLSLPPSQPKSAHVALPVFGGVRYNPLSLIRLKAAVVISGFLLKGDLRSGVINFSLEMMAETNVSWMSLGRKTEGGDGFPRW